MPRAYQFDSFRLSTHARTLSRDGVAVPLTGREFDTLWALVRRSGQLTTKADLAAEVWRDAHVSDNNLRQQIRSLRVKLGHDADANDYIRTVPNQGYQFTARVLSIDDEAPSSPPEASPAPVPVPLPRRWLLASAGALALVTLAVTLASSAMRHPTVLTRLPRGRVLLRSTSEGSQPIDISLGYQPDHLAISPSGDLLFATHDPGSTLLVLAIADSRVKTLQLPRDAASMAVSPDGALYVASPVDGVMVVSIDSAGARVREILPTGGPVWDIAITPDGGKLFLAMEGHGAKSLSLASRRLSTLTDRACPEHVSIDPQGKRLFVAYQCSGPEGRPGHDSVEVFDAQTERSLGIIHDLPMVGGKPAISPDGKLVILDGEDACGAPQYDHQGCPPVLSHVYHLIRTEDLQHLRTFTDPTAFSPAYFLDNARFLMLGYHLSVYDAERFTVVEKLAAGGSSTLRPMVLAPDGSRAYVGYGSARGVNAGPGGIRVFPLEPQSCDPNRAGLVNLYAADGTFEDSAGFETLVPQGRIGFSPGRVGQAFHFDGGFLSASAKGHWPLFGMHDASFSLYARMTSTEGRDVLIDWSATNPPRGIRLSRAGDRILFESWPGGVPLRSRQLIAANTWYHLAVTKTGQAVTLYVNGVAEDRQPSPPPFAGLDRPLTLGSDGAGHAAFRGWLDEIADYSRALTAQEVRDLYQLRESGACKL